MYKIKEIKVSTVREIAVESKMFDTPQKAFDFWNKAVVESPWYDTEKEHCVVLCLDRKNNLKSYNLVSIGTVSSSLLMPREVFRPAIVSAASAIILMHNHPSGDPAPSRADIEITRKIKESAEILGIDFLDHIIVGSSLYSFREAGLI